MEKNTNLIDLKNIDFNKIITSPSFQKKITENVQIIIINMDEKEYNKGIKKNGSKEKFIESIRKTVLTRMVNNITNKLFSGTSIVATGILSSIGISNMKDIDWTKIDWGKLDWSKIEIDLSHVKDEILGEGFSNFLTWITDTTFEWIDDLEDYF